MRLCVCISALKILPMPSSMLYITTVFMSSFGTLHKKVILLIFCGLSAPNPAISNIFEVAAAITQ